MAMRAAPLFSPSEGPLRPELFFMADLLRKEDLPPAEVPRPRRAHRPAPRRACRVTCAVDVSLSMPWHAPPDPHACYPHQGNAVEPRAWQVKAGEDTVVKLLMSATAKKVKRPWWEHQTTQLIVDGAIRRGHLMALISPETLKRVGFAAQELLDAAFGLAELREGGYLAKELRLIGLKAAELGQAGYTPAELNAGGYTAKDLKQAEFSASEMKSGGCTADASPRPSSLRARQLAMCICRLPTSACARCQPSQLGLPAVRSPSSRRPPGNQTKAPHGTAGTRPSNSRTLRSRRRSSKRTASRRQSCVRGPSQPAISSHSVIRLPI